MIHDWQQYRDRLVENSSAVKTYQTGPDIQGHKAKILEAALNNTRQLLALTPEQEDFIYPAIAAIVPNLLAFELTAVQGITTPHDIFSVLRLPIKTHFPSIGDELPHAQTLSSRIGVVIQKTTPTFNDRTLTTKTPLEFEPRGFAKDCIREADQDLLKRLRAISPTVRETYDQSALKENPHFIGDLHAALAFTINRQCSLIGHVTRRGMGNRVVLSKTALTVLLSAQHKVVESLFHRPLEGTAVTKLVGTLSNSIALYLDAEAEADTPVLCLYRGAAIDAGLFASPYLPLRPAGIVDGIQHYNAVDAYYEMEAHSAYLGKASDFISQIGINTKTLTFT